MHRFPHACAALLLFLPAWLAAQPVAPSPNAVASLRSLASEPPRAADSTPLTVNTASREEVRQFFRAIYSASEHVSMGWTGDYSTGNAGDTSAAYKEATRLRINFYRALVGVPAAITLNTTFSSKDQQAALMMSGNNTLQHTGIPTSWTYYTSGGAEAAANSNLALGSAGPDAITGYMADAGSNNAAAGHRRWLQYPQTREMGTGDVPGNSTLFSANATWVIDAQFGTTRPATRTTQVTYPPAGYVPYELVFPRWSFSYPGADFSSATVTMSRGGQSIPVTLEPLSSSIGEPTLVWVYNNLATDTQNPHPKPTSDTTYTVTVSNVRIGGSTQSFTYNVVVFDPDVAGSDFSPVSISGSASPTVGAANSYSVALPSFVSSFDWRTLQLATFSKVYGAENGLDGITASTSSGYSVTQSGVVGAGTAAFHLAHPNPPTDQILTLPDTFLVTSDSASLSFLSRLGFATATQIAHAQISSDDGVSWTDVYTQAGTGGSGEGSFATRTASLASYKNRTIQVRFLYDSTGTYFPQTSNGIGWYIDNITVTGVQAVTAATPTRITSGSSFNFTPSSAGAATLQARGVLFGAYPLDWSSVLQVTAAPGSSGPNTSYLSNLSVRTTAGSGAQTLIVGFTVSGGSKQLLIRGIGPTLSLFGLSGVLSDPKLELYTSASAKIDENDNWAASASATFDAVQAFGLPANSKDAALVSVLSTGSYSAQVSGNGGSTGLALIELYDVAGTGNGSRLVNVSARSQVGTGGEILIAGFTVSGNGQRNLLIRGIGPTLANFGVGGVLANPKLELYSGNTKLQENDDWGGSATVATAANTVFAFGLPSNSKDSALVVALSPGQYTVQVSGVGSTTGVALIEVYELP